MDKSRDIVFCSRLGNPLSCRDIDIVKLEVSFISVIFYWSITLSRILFR